MCMCVFISLYAALFSYNIYTSSWHCPTTINVSLLDCRYLELYLAIYVLYLVLLSVYIRCLHTICQSKSLRTLINCLTYYVVFFSINFYLYIMWYWGDIYSHFAHFNKYVYTNFINMLPGDQGRAQN